MDITAAAIATIISSCVATIVSLLINRRNQKKDLNDQLDAIVKISIQYPYLESPRFTNTWNENKGKDLEQYIRYENYCVMVFNFMERLCKFYKFDKTKIEGHINLKQWIRIHQDCWNNPAIPFENSDSYPTKLKELLNSYLK